MAGKGDRNRSKNPTAFKDGWDAAFGGARRSAQIPQEELMSTYEQCLKQVQTYCGMGDPSVVVSFLLKEIRCRDNRITAYEDEVSDLKLADQCFNGEE